MCVLQETRKLRATALCLHKDMNNCRVDNRNCCIGTGIHKHDLGLLNKRRISINFKCGEPEKFCAIIFLYSLLILNSRCCREIKQDSAARPVNYVASYKTVFHINFNQQPKGISLQICCNFYLLL